LFKKRQVVNMSAHPKNPHIRNGKLARLLICASRKRKNPLARLLIFLAGCEFCISLPDSTYLPHPQGIVVGHGVRLGENVVIGHQVTLGGRDLEIGNMPDVGDGVYLGAGAKILGKLKVGAGATIGANAVVTKDVPAGAVVVGANRILPGKRSAYA
jgi:serine O-acetyltransferase